MRIIIADDDRLVCDSLKIILGAQPDVEVVGAATGGAEAVRLYAEARPDIALLDIQMPDMSGLDAAREILARDPQARVVFLTTFSDDDYIVRALALGTRGYLIKQDVATIAPALRAVMSGQSVLEGEVLARVALVGAQGAAGGASGSGGTAARLDEKRPRAAGERGGGGGAAGSGARDTGEPARAGDEGRGGTDSAVAAMRKRFSCLTDREFEVMRLIAEGLSNREVAAAAYMSEGTVRNHISTMLAKLGLKNRTQLAIAYWRA